jgi:predicted protein tyrosine phosphatase
MNIVVCPLSLAPDMAKLRKPARIVSLLDPLSRFPAIEGYGADRHLCVEVHDINVEEEGLDACCDQRMSRILEFVGGWDREAPILIHCYAGISRSTATAFITACAHNPKVDEFEIAQALRAASPSAFPNRRFVALADDALGRNGRMSDAIQSIGAGHSWLDIGEAKPFMLSGRYG